LPTVPAGRASTDQTCGLKRRPGTVFWNPSLRNAVVAVVGLPPSNRLSLIAALTLAVAAGVLLAAGCRASARTKSEGASPRAASLPTVACGESIGYAKAGHEDGYRGVLGVLSVPPAYLSQVVATHSQPWRYWRKAGLVVRTGNPSVVISVPKAWRSRAAVTWGSSGTVSVLRVEGCPPSPAGWRAYAGGFYLGSRSTCVPLVFRVGQRAATVRFGIGRRCDATS
jgi:hypothetical protein